MNLEFKSTYKHNPLVNFASQKQKINQTCRHTTTFSIFEILKIGFETFNLLHLKKT
jgi:hypothetical protein